MRRHPGIAAVLLLWLVGLVLSIAPAQAQTTQPFTPQFFTTFSDPGACRTGNFYLRLDTGVLSLCGTDSLPHEVAQSTTTSLASLTADNVFTGLQDLVAGKLVLPETVVGSLPTAAAGNSGHVYLATDAVSPLDCTVGSGSAKAICRSSGSAWVSVLTGLLGPSPNIGAATGTSLTLTAALSAASFLTATNCSSAASPAVCAAAASGSVAVAADATTLVVNTTKVTANSQIILTFDKSLGTKLGITCNTVQPAVFGVSARTAATSFTIEASASTTDAACFSYTIIN